MDWIFKLSPPEFILLGTIAPIGLGCAVFVVAAVVQSVVQHLRRRAG